MLDTIRRHQKSWLTYLIFLAIIIVFAVNFGPGSGSCGGFGDSSYAAIVDGEYISQQDFALAYGQQLEQMRRRARASQFDFTEQIAEQMGLRQQVIDGLISEKLLAKEAERRGLRISDAELLEYLHKAYKVKDVSVEDYRSFVERNFRMTVSRFEAERRNDLLAQKIAQFLQDNITISEHELRDDYLREHDRAMIEYVKFDITSIKLTEPSAAEIEKLIAAEPQTINDHYQTDLNLYRTPEERQARVIMFKLAKETSEAEVTRLRSQLNTLKDQIKTGADFAALCKEHSQDEKTKNSSCDLDWHKRSELNPLLEQAIFTIKTTNELANEPVHTDNNLYLIQLTAIKPSTTKTKDKIKNEITTSILRKQTTDTQLSATTTTLLNKLKNNKKLENLTINKTNTKKDKTKANTKTNKVKAKDKSAPGRAGRTTL